MRMKLLKIVMILLLAGTGDSRPQKTDEPARVEAIKVSNEGWKVVVPSSNATQEARRDSSVADNDDQRHLKDLQYIDQSLRTVATQLLNVTSPEEPHKLVVEENVGKMKHQKDNNEASLIKEVNSEISNLESMGIGFGRPINSKFAYFESSHPGQAMAITEEELEREMSSTRLMTAYKNHPTTTGGISTWILLNPPSTTAKTSTNYNVKEPSETEVRTTMKPTMERVETTIKVNEKSSSHPSSTVSTEKITSSTKKPMISTTMRRTSTVKPETTQNVEKFEYTRHSSTEAPYNMTTSHASNKEASTFLVSTTKKVQIVRTTPKPKITTSKDALSKPATNKTSRPSRPKPSTRRTTIKPDIVRNENASTARIEKVTFRPVQMITTPKVNKTEATEKPMFVTKIKASILMDTQKTSSTTPSTSVTTMTTTTPSPSIVSKTVSSATDFVQVPTKVKPTGTKVNNVLKVQLKNPADETTRIEIEPIKVNAPILTIEQVNKDKKQQDDAIDKGTDILDDSKIDLKFEFNPELTKIHVETSTESSTETTTSITATSTSSTTTKRPRQNSKRKKNKVRRRKPTTPSSTSTTTVSTILSSMENDTPIEPLTSEVGMQESKIAPETKVTNSTKTKKGQKPISTQIYNFLSREVMPSFGVMSLLGLGLGLASYFLYPFGGTIARRNYEVEPKYKYNIDEYGGNYGQSEEEVLLKVLQGMTDNKYTDTKDENNYYRYKHYDGRYDPYATRKNDPRYPAVPSSPIYRPDNTPSVTKYRNTEHRYPEAPTTPNYYDKPKDISNTVNRQFVVGNVPKEYPTFVEKHSTLPTPGKLSGYEATESGGQTDFEREIAQSFNFPVNPVNLQNYGHQGTEAVRPDDGYEEIEITPTAVAVEHGPRSLRKRSLDESFNLPLQFVQSTYSKIRSTSPNVESSRDKRFVKGEEVRRSRLTRESVVQVIPPKRQLEETEEDLSNEILDIIDSALPEPDYDVTKNRREDNEVEDLQAQKTRRQEEEKMRLKESTMKTVTNDTKDNTENRAPTEESNSSAMKDVTVSSVDSSISDSTSKDSSKDSSTIENSEGGSSSTRSAEEYSTVEWIAATTKKPVKHEGNGFNLFGFVKKVAEIKFRLGLTLLKHASEGFARYLGRVQKRINEEE